MDELTPDLIREVYANFIAIEYNNANRICGRGCRRVTPVKREAGANPARSRRCMGEALRLKVHWSNPGRTSGAPSNPSQKTCPSLRHPGRKPPRLLRTMGGCEALVAHERVRHVCHVWHVCSE